MTRRRLLSRVLLALVVAFGAGYLVALAARFGGESVQADFSAFYTAGQAARAGRSPYWNAPDHVPPLWDGVSVYASSRFLYPPLAASLFAPLTWLDYATAKHAWMVLTLAAVALALAVFARALRPALSVEAALAVGAFACLFHPLRVHLERGQVDAITLLLVALAFRPMITAGRDSIGSGLLLALGSVLKPNVAALVPFLVLRRRWRALAGFAAGGAAALALTVALHGTDGLVAYLTRELPRISVEGEAHGEEGRLAPAVIARLRANAPPGMTVRDGRLYRIESFRFVTNASLARPLKRRLALRLSPSRLALVLLAGSVAVAALALRERVFAPGAPAPLRELAFLQAALAAVLLAWPVTLAMNAVWLLPGAVLVASAWPAARDGRARAALAACAAGLALAAVPDGVAAVFGDAARLRYVVAELVVFASLLAGLRYLPEGRHDQGEDGHAGAYGERFAAGGPGESRHQ